MDSSGMTSTTGIAGISAKGVVIEDSVLVVVVVVDGWGDVVGGDVVVVVEGRWVTAERSDVLIHQNGVGLVAVRVALVAVVTGLRVSAAVEVLVHQKDE